MWWSGLQVGKWGLTANCITAISDALEANELVKVTLKPQIFKAAFILSLLWHILNPVRSGTYTR